MFWLTLGIIISAIGGIFLTLYIKKEKFAEVHPVCPQDGSCKELSAGHYSKFLGIPLENIGLVFYITTTLIFLASLFQEISIHVLLFGLLLAGAGFAFSLYLMIIQFFVIKKWCVLCLGSAAITFMIMVLAFMGYESLYLEFAYTSRDLMRWIFGGVVIVGTLATTAHAKIFISFLKDFVINPKEYRRLNMYSHTGWVSIGLIILSGVGIVATDIWREYTDASNFIPILVVVGMLIAYEFVVNLRVAPKLLHLHLEDEPVRHDHTHAMNRKLAFSFMGVGVASWYYLLMLVSFNWFDTSSGQLLLWYFIVVLVAVVITMLVETMIYRKSERLYLAEDLKQVEENIEEEK